MDTKYPDQDDMDVLQSTRTFNQPEARQPKHIEKLECFLCNSMHVCERTAALLCDH